MSESKEALKVQSMCLYMWACAEFCSHMGQTGHILGQRAFQGCLSMKSYRPHPLNATEMRKKWRKRQPSEKEGGREQGTVVQT